MQRISKIIHRKEILSSSHSKPHFTPSQEKGELINDYLSTNNILSSSQFGFRSGASTEHALLKFIDNILKCFDDNKVGIATFMDLSKAFDYVNHKILLTKIKRYGVHSTPLRWISSYLSNSEHFVSWNQIHSTSLNLNIGVPQGSILGPCSF